jgi:hypothetical protein
MMWSAIMDSSCICTVEDRKARISAIKGDLEPFGTEVG